MRSDNDLYREHGRQNPVALLLLKDCQVKIVFLGWGSLIWNPGTLALAGEWRLPGPTLPIEFSRISDNGRLSLVIDETHGAQVITRFAPASTTDLAAAIESLRQRERTPNRNRIGFIDLVRGRYCKRAKTQHPVALAGIRKWAQDKGVEGVVWTALGPRFDSIAGEPFSGEAAVRYLQQLSEEKRAVALAYIRQAPEDLDTPVRREVRRAFPQ